MSCLNPISIKNPKYRLIPFREYSVTIDGVFCGIRPDDSALLVPCGKCIQCLKRKRNDMCFRLMEEYLYNPTRAFFITLTLNDESLELFKRDAKLMFRKWFESVRYRVGSSFRHFIVSELGEHTKRLHFHGILFDVPEHVTAEQISKLWTYGFSYVGYVNEKSIRYITKYITKPQLKADWYKPFILASNRPGIGECFVHKLGVKEMLLQNNLLVSFGSYNLPLPRYYFTKIFSEQERFDMAKERDSKIRSDTSSFISDILRRSKTSSIAEYMDALKNRYKTSLSLGQSISLTKHNNLSLTKLNNIQQWLY